MGRVGNRVRGGSVLCRLSSNAGGGVAGNGLFTASNLFVDESGASNIRTGLGGLGVGNDPESCATRGDS